MFNKILFPIDFKKHSEAVLSGLYSLKKFGVEEVVLLNVIEYDIEKLMESGVDVDGLIQKLKKDSEAKLVKKTEELKRNFKVKTLPPLPAMDPVAEITKVAKKEDVSLILLTSTSSGLKGSIMGSVSGGIVRGAEVPVMVLKAKHEAGEGYYELQFKRLFDRIIYPNGYTGDSLAIKEKVKEAALMGGKEIELLHILEIDDIIKKENLEDQIKHPLVPIPNLTEIISKYWIEAYKKLEDVQKSFENSGISTKIVIKIGSPNKEIRKIANEDGGTVIMLNISKELSNEVESIIRYSDVPVIVFRDAF